MASAQEVIPERPFILAPLPVTPKDWHVSVGLTLVTPPRDITEEILLRVPAFDLHALYGVPSNFYLDGRAISQVVQNHFSLGVRWAHPTGKFSFSLGYDVGWWFGFLEVDGFDSEGNGWIGYPNVTLGYDLEDVYLLFKTEAIFNLAYQSFVGEEEISTNVDTFSGLSFTFALEQPFYKNTHVTLALKATYTKFHWQTWSLFSTFDRYLFYPEITVGFIL